MILRPLEGTQTLWLVTSPKRKIILKQTQQSRQIGQGTLGNETYVNLLKREDSDLDGDLRQTSMTESVIYNWPLIRRPKTGTILTFFPPLRLDYLRIHQKTIYRCRSLLSKEAPLFVLLLMDGLTARSPRSPHHKFNSLPCRQDLQRHNCWHETGHPICFNLMLFFFHKST